MSAINSMLGSVLRKVFSLHLFRWSLTPLILFLAGGQFAYAGNTGGTPTCAATRNIVINELNTFNTEFSELFVTGSGVSVSGMILKLSKTLGGTPTSVNVGVGNGVANPGTGVNELDSVSLTYSAPTWIRYTNTNVLIDKNNNGQQIALFDSAGNVLDMVTLTTGTSCNYTNTYWANPGSCNTCVTGLGSSIKDYFRFPDGGAVTNSDSGNSAGGAGGSSATSNLGDSGITPPTGSNGFFAYCVNNISTNCATQTVTADVNLVYQSTSRTPMCASPFIIPKNGTAISFIANIGAPSAGSATRSPASMTWTGTTTGNTTAVAQALTLTSVTGDASGNLTFAVTDSVLSGISTSTTVALGCSAGVFDAYETSYTAANAIAGTAKIKTHVASDTGLCINGGACNIKIGSFNASKTALNTSFVGPVKIEIVDSASGTCATYSPIATVSASQILSGTGETTVTLPAVANSYADARIRISYPTTSPTIISCSSDNFAIRPSNFASVTATDDTRTTAGSSNTLSNMVAATTPPVHNAGRPFSLNAMAVNVSGTTTTNYNGTPTATLSQCAGTACSAALGVMALGGTFSSGILASTTATYDEVGAFSLVLQDTTFANVDSGDSSSAERNISSSTVTVGRFVPDHFDTAIIAGGGVPMACPSGLTCPALNAAVPAVTGLVYAGQSFTTQVTARNAAGLTTFNYNTTTGLSKDVSLSVWDALGSATAGTGTLANNNVLASAFSNGVASISTTSYSYATTPTVPTAIYLRAQDSDNVTSLRAPPSSSLEGGVEVVSGRIKVYNAYGSELLPLRIATTVQLYNSTGSWVVSDTDTVTTIAASDFALAFPVATANKLAACETALSVTGSSPNFNVNLSAPGAGNNGWTDLTLNLGAVATGNRCTVVGGAGAASTTANRPWLQYPVGTNPVARGTFGVYKSNNNFIYQRESY